MALFKDSKLFQDMKLQKEEQVRERDQQRREREITNRPVFEERLRRLWGLWGQRAPRKELIFAYISLQEAAILHFQQGIAIAQSEVDIERLVADAPDFETWAFMNTEIASFPHIPPLRALYGWMASYKEYNQHQFEEHLGGLVGLLDERNPPPKSESVSPPVTRPGAPLPIADARRDDLSDLIEAFVDFQEIAKHYFGQALLDYQFMIDETLYRLQSGFCTVLGCDARAGANEFESGDRLCPLHFEEQLKKNNQETDE